MKRGRGRGRDRRDWHESWQERHDKWHERLEQDPQFAQHARTWRHRRGHGAWGPGHFVAARMHRRLFIWFGWTIFTTCMAIFGAVTLVHQLADDGGPRANAGRIGIAVAIMSMVLWGITGAIARRITRPLSELTRVAQDIGAGHLESRARLLWRQPGEVGALAHAINDMAGKIEKQLADARTLMAMVSHELRTPLARLRVLVELARNDPSRVASAFDEIEREVGEIDALVGELLATSKLDFAALNRQTVDAGDVAKRALERAGIAPSNAHVESNTTVSADPTLLARALSNLLENAKKHARSSTTLRVHTDETHVHFICEDDGPGIASADPDKIFEMFYQEAGARERDPKSLGLGLALVRRIADAHGGAAYAENRSEGGARIGFSLHLQTPDDD